MKKLIVLILIIGAFVVAKNLLEKVSDSGRTSTTLSDYASTPDRVRGQVTGADRHIIQTQVTMFMTTYNRRPTALSELVDQNMLGQSNTVDPWGHPYKEEWTETELILRSDGEDGVGGSPDDTELRIPIAG